MSCGNHRALSTLNLTQTTGVAASRGLIDVTTVLLA